MIFCHLGNAENDELVASNNKLEGIYLTLKIFGLQNALHFIAQTHFLKL